MQWIRISKGAQNFAEKFGCQYASDLNEIKGKNIDVLHLCLPHYLHAPVAIQAMRAGINVLTEKPISLSLQEADELFRVQQDRKSVV